MKTININLNDLVMFRLTKVGRQHVRELNKGCRYSDNPLKYKRGWNEVRLWELMHIFGSELHTGGVEPIGMNIKVLVDI